MSKTRAFIHVDELVDGKWRKRLRYKVDAALIYDRDLVEGIRIQGAISELPPRDYRCLVCGEPDAFDSYMVHDELWTRFWPKDAGACHLRCFESKLGRRIVLEDLKKEPTMNSMLLHVLSSR